MGKHWVNEFVNHKNIHCNVQFPFAAAESSTLNMSNQLQLEQPQLMSLQLFRTLLLVSFFSQT